MLKITNEELAKIAKSLREYNEWRRGAETEQPHPKLIGKDIDAAIMIIEMIVDEAKNEEIGK